MPNNKLDRRRDFEHTFAVLIEKTTCAHQFLPVFYFDFRSPVCNDSASQRVIRDRCCHCRTDSQTCPNLGDSFCWANSFGRTPGSFPTRDRCTSRGTRWGDSKNSQSHEQHLGRYRDPASVFERLQRNCRRYKFPCRNNPSHKWSSPQRRLHHRPVHKKVLLWSRQLLHHNNQLVAP